MGAARERGTREQRVEQSIARTAAAKAARVAAEQARWDALTPEQQQAEVAERRRSREAVRKLHMMTALVASGAMGSGGRS